MRHLVAMAVPIAAGMALQTLYFIVDLYFVARLGEAALAGVSAAGNVMFVVFALTQMLGVGAVALISQAVGRNDRADANHVFNQSIALSVLCAVITLIGGYGLASAYMRPLSADAATMAAGVTFLHWFVPGLALQFAMVVMGSALRGTGIVKPTMLVQAATVLLNTLLARCSSRDGAPGTPWGWRERRLPVRLRLRPASSSSRFIFSSSSGTCDSTGRSCVHALRHGAAC